MKVMDKNYTKIVQKIQTLSKMMKNHSFKTSENPIGRLRKHGEKRRLEYMVKHAKKEVAVASGMIKSGRAQTHATRVETPSTFLKMVSSLQKVGARAS